MSRFTSTLHIVFGTMTGNAEDLANRFAERCQKEGIEHELCSAEDWDLSRFSEAQYMVLIFSTWGEGEPPDEAIDFCEAVYAQKVEVKGLEYVVVGLGDTSYEEFCGCARKLDESLESAGAIRIQDRLELDIDFDKDFDTWVDRFFASDKVVEHA